MWNCLIIIDVTEVRTCFIIDVIPVLVKPLKLHGTTGGQCETVIVLNRSEPVVALYKNCLKM